MGKDFVIECDESVFTDDEIAMLKKDLEFFSKLATGLHKPENDVQKKFVKVNKGLIAPSDEYQKLWFKYITRCEWEKGNQTAWQAYHDDKLRSLIIKSYVKTIPPSSSKEPRNRSARNLNFPKNKRSTSGKGDIPEGYRKRIDEGISGSREDFKKNKRFDG
jgi:uncharacterized protein YifE (UPF0438 family)